MGDSQLTDDLANLSADLRARVMSGELTVHPGQNPLKPVLRDAVTGQLVKGSGRAPKAGDPAVASAAAAAVSYQKKKTYQEAMDLLMDVDAPASVKGSYAWLYEKAMWAAEGAPQQVKVICPHTEYGEDGEKSYCQNPDHADRVVVQRPDGQLIFKLLELKHGRAKETVEVGGTINHMVEIMEAREVPFLVYDVSPAELAERTSAVDDVLEGAGPVCPPDRCGRYLRHPVPGAARLGAEGHRRAG